MNNFYQILEINNQDYLILNVLQNKTISVKMVMKDKTYILSFINNIDKPSEKIIGVLPQKYKLSGFNNSNQPYIILVDSNGCNLRNAIDYIQPPMQENLIANAIFATEIISDEQDANS